ncbi:hypothetical protein BO85DRAFT_490815 [Aspergillus piperis CBS 112811]|uniref:Uncharacterized protein n=1 Tax=Aspergillus piperis CBS 112811 TaxID=1448313 RepID=A0A8G1VIK0_9EURO|nr:hypothetical protein BO85DRAFT_490815 [Aspergillus piperis CBS 112811]RAH54619.1 hypothetical protein BO85DRAFT_490815 [Aspergillus piperis CBS 112811]
MATSVPNHRMIENKICADGAFIVIISRAVLFEITLRASEFFGTSLESQVNEWLKKVNRSEKATDFEEASNDSENFEEFWDCLQSFTFPRAHALQLLPIDKLITAVPTVYRCFSKSTLPTISASISGLPPGVPKVSAADVLIYQDPDSEFDHTCDIPRHVQVAERGLLFKPANNTSAFINEVSALSRVSELGLSINVSKLYAIVLSENGKIILGILIDWLPFGSRNLWSDTLAIA